MFKAIGNMVMNVICEDDAHEQIDPIILGTALALLTFLGLAVYQVIATHTFNYQEFGIGTGTILGGAGAGKFGKAKADAIK